MSDMPKRNITGHCEGECRDRVREADSFPNAPGAKSRNDQPGWLGGHV